MQSTTILRSFNIDQAAQRRFEDTAERRQDLHLVDPARSVERWLPLGIRTSDASSH